LLSIWKILFERLLITEGGRCAGDVLKGSLSGSRELEPSVRHLLARGANSKQLKSRPRRRSSIYYEEAKKYLESGLLRGPHTLQTNLNLRAARDIPSDLQTIAQLSKEQERID
jgi:hypothetical protein